jgi:hypothetical protein
MEKMTNPLMVDLKTGCKIVADAQKTGSYFVLSAVNATADQKIPFRVNMFFA